jgi:hypothetical protein
VTKKAFQSFAKNGPDGVIVVVSEDDAFADDHPFVKKWPEMFGELEDVITITSKPSKAPVVEQETAAPGELRRGPGRPRKDSYDQ